MLFFWYNKIGMLIVQGQATRREIVFLKVDHQETKCLRQIVITKSLISTQDKMAS